MMKKVPLMLNAHDAAILEVFQESLSATASDVLRFALRFYALNGPLDSEDRQCLHIVIPPGHKLPDWDGRKETVAP